MSIGTNSKPIVQKKRHIAKAITWRLVGTLDTWLISYFLVLFGKEHNNDASEIASYIAGLELISKTLLYYLHERIWYKLDFVAFNQNVRHVLKTISWRFFGAIDTLLLVYAVYFFSFGKVQGASGIAVSMFSIEIFTKMILYYLHERIWFKSNWGVIKTGATK